jgi:hypothetical protein
MKSKTKLEKERMEDMSKKLIILLCVAAIVGLGVKGLARIDIDQNGPAQVFQKASLSTARDLSQDSPPDLSHLLNEGEVVLDPVILSNPSPDDTIHFDGPYDNNAVGLTSGGTYKGAMRMTPTELGAYAGWDIIAVIWYHHEAAPHGDMLEIFDQNSSSQPGAVLHTQPFSQTGTGWKREDLTSPVAIGGGTDLWCSLQVTHAAGEYPIGVDAGPAVATKGDFVFFSGSWDELGNLGLSLNWNIRAIVDSGGAVPNNDVRTLSIDNPGAMVDPMGSLNPAATVRNQGLLSATFDVVCQIDSAATQVYTDTFTIVGMPSSTDSSITFGSWTAGPSGTVYDVTV